MSDWFERWFGEEYLALYPHRDERDAAAGIALLERVLDGRARGRVLDLACGAGRHTRQLSRFGWTVGLDLSPVLLRVARQADPEGSYVRADMRVLPFADASFALVVSLFTSFGYFATDDEHDTTLREVARTLERGGFFVLDFLNADHVRSNLVERDERQIGKSVVEQRRSISPDGRYVVKRITLRPDGRTFQERVRLFTREQLVALVERAGLTVESIFGDYDGRVASAESPRAIVFAEAR